MQIVSASPTLLLNAILATWAQFCKDCYIISTCTPSCPATGTAWLWWLAWAGAWLCYPDVTFHIQQRMGYNCNPTHFITFIIRTVYESIGWYLNWFVFDKISVSVNLVCFCKFTWRILHHRCTILSILIKSPRSGVTLCFQSVSATSAAAKTFPSHIKTIWAKPLIFGTKNIWVWGIVLDDLSMTLTQGHGCGSQNVLVCPIKWEPLIRWLQNMGALLP